MPIGDNRTEEQFDREVRSPYETTPVPELCWQWRAKEADLRIVLTGTGPHFVVERLEHDAMGKERWVGQSDLRYGELPYWLVPFLEYLVQSTVAWRAQEERGEHNRKMICKLADWLEGHHPGARGSDESSVDLAIRLLRELKCEGCTE